ncbi:MAG: hypothetical protein DRI24_20625 [Deltaproteobacteria bacterium]|nr:MAG: hypothetical protein DRI24_20625 [Deltaproteobacteria bacterium]
MLKKKQSVGIELVFVVLSILLSMSGCEMSDQQEHKVSDILPPEGFAEVGGSNYVMCRVDESYRVRNEPESWWRPGVLELAVGHYHQQDPKEIRRQLRTMYENGQRKIAVLIWISQFMGEETDGHKVVDGVFGHCMVSKDGKLQAQHQENTRELVKLIRDTGYFNELIFRFAFQGGGAGPESWEQWNEEQYQHNWKVLVSTRAIIEKALNGSEMKVLYDLGAEIAGLENGQVPQYTRRMWKDYTQAYGKDDTYGFSVAVYPGRTANLLKVFEEVGVYPDIYSRDVYEHVQEWLGAAGKEFAEAGIKHPRIIIQETYYNDPQSLAELQKAGKDFGFEYLYLMQWPLKRGHPVPHFSDDYAAEYDAYLTKKN